MYLPKQFRLDDRADILGVLRERPFGHLVTGGSEADRPIAATPLPFVVDEEITCVRAHFSRANRHWRSIDGAPALLIVPTVDAYVSPRWYPSKAEHGKVVPTWNYEVIHLRGTVEIHHDAGWKRALVSELTDRSEAAVPPVPETGDRPASPPERHAVPAGSTSADSEPWQVSDAPEDFIAGQLKAIVGVQLNVTEVIGKRKLSQNRSEPDRRGAQDGLEHSPRAGDVATADRMSTGA